MKPLEFDLQRNLSLPDRTIGDLSVNGKFICNTLEDKERLWYNNLGALIGVKIFGKTAIPLGRYEIVMAYSERFKRKLPLLLKVPQFDGILIHGGVDPTSTEGCICVGKYDPVTKNIYGAKSLGILDKVVNLIEEGLKTGKVFINVR